jgi:ribonuclease P protein component
MRLRPEQHLRTSREIRMVREGGRKEDCRAFAVWWRLRESAEVAKGRRRVGVVASKVAVGTAVQRNRAKRRLRELFRRNQGLLPAGCDVLMVARRAAIEGPFDELEKRFIGACARIASSASLPKTDA